MTVTPMVSVVIPAYNIAAFLPECIRCLRRQTFSDWEAVLVDDGSTDETGSLCDTFAAEDARFRVLHLENGGQARARNRGIEICRGRYLTFIDGDDLISDSYLADLVGLLDTGAEICMVSGQDVFDRTAFCSLRPAEPAVLPAERAAARLLLRERFTHGTWGKLYPMSFWKNFRFPEGVINEDYLTTYRLIAMAERVAFLDNGSYFYYHRPGSTMNAAFSERTLMLLDAADEVTAFVIDHWPALADRANDLKAASYLKTLQAILNHDLTSYPAEQTRILRFCRPQILPLCLSRDVPPKDKIKLLLLIPGRHVFRTVYNRFSG